MTGSPRSRDFDSEPGAYPGPLKIGEVEDGGKTYSRFSAHRLLEANEENYYRPWTPRGL